MQILKIILVFNFIVFSTSIYSQQKNNLFYQQIGKENSALVKAVLNQQKFNLLQKDLQKAQITKPQISITADYLLAPYFFNNKQLIDVTQNPEKKAFGYDIGITNGGLYAGQLNASLPLFTGGTMKTYTDFNSLQNQITQNELDKILHDLNKEINEKYIAVYQCQTQIKNEDRIIDLVKNRKTIAKELVKNGLMQSNDYLLLEIEIKQRQFEKEQFNINLSNSLNALNNSCGIADTTMAQLEEPTFTTTQPKQNFKIQQKFELDSSSIEQQQIIINTKYKPQLFAFGNTGFNGVDAANLPHNIGLSAGFHFSYPLYDGGQKKIMSLQNKILIDNLLQQKNMDLIATNNYLKTLNQQINFIKKSIDLINSQLGDQETLLQIIKDKVVLGQISVTDYLGALQDYANSGQNKILSQVNLWLLINQFNYINW